MFPINYSDMAFETIDLGQKLDNGKKITQLTDGPGLIYRILKGPETFVVKGLTTENLKNSLSDLSEKNLQKLGLERDDGDVKYYPTYSIELADNLVKKILNQRFSYKEGLVRNISDPGSTSWMKVEDDNFKICLAYSESKDFENIGVIGERKEVLDLFKQTVAKLGTLIPEYEFGFSDIELSLKTPNKSNFYFQALKGIFHVGKMENEIIEYFGPYLDNHLLDFLMETSALRGLWQEITGPD
jgi:hypothetical protein